MNVWKDLSLSLSKWERGTSEWSASADDVKLLILLPQREVGMIRGRSDPEEGGGRGKVHDTGKGTGGQAWSSCGTLPRMTLS